MQRYFKNKRDKKGYMDDSEDTKQFYESLGAIIKMNTIQHINLEFMNLGDKVMLMTEYLVQNTSLYTVHLSNNYISEGVLNKLKWMLSVGIHHE